MHNIHSLRNLSLEKKSALVFVFATAISSGLNMITTPFFTRLMPVDSFGVVQLFNTWYQVLAVFATFSVTNAIIFVGFHNYADDRMGYLSSSLGLATFSTVIISLIAFFTQKYFFQISGLNASLLILLTLSFLFLNATQLWICLQKYELKYKKVFLVVVSSGILSSALSLLAVYYTNSSYAEVRLWSSQAIPILLGIVIFIYICIKGCKFFNKKYWLFIITFNAPLLIHYLSQFILTSSDRLMINYYCNEADVAIYSLAYLVSNILLVFFSPINSVIIPRTHRLLDDKNYREIASFLYKLLIYIGIFIFLISLLSPEIIAVLGGENYVGGIKIVPIVSFSTLFNVLYIYVANIEFLYGKTYRIALITIIAALLNIVLNALLIPIFGFTAAAYTTLVAYCIYAILHIYNMSSLLKCRIFSYGKLFVICLIFMALCFISVILSNMIIPRYILFLLSLLLVLYLHKRLKLKV